jgi:hypothetical protein
MLSTLVAKHCVEGVPRLVNVNDFKLDPDQVPVLQGHISWAAEEAERRVEDIMRSYSSTVGTATWSSAAANAALSVQVDENSPKWKKLMGILDELSQGVYKAAGMQMDQVEQGRHQIQSAVTSTTGGSTMATNYQSRL